MRGRVIPDEEYLEILCQEWCIPLRKAPQRSLTRDDLRSEAQWWWGKSIVMRGHIEAIRSQQERRAW